MLRAASEPTAHDTAPAGFMRFVPLLVLAEVVALYAPTAAWLYGRWTMSVWHNAHGLIIPFVVAYFVQQELKSFSGRPMTGSAWGFAILIPALILQSIDAGLHTQLLSAVSLVMALPGLSLLFLGWERTKAIAFPLAFAAFMLPIPLSFTERIHLWLRQIATFGTETAMPLLGIPVLADGTTLHFASASLTVSDACSGFSTLYAAMAVACLTAYSANSTSRRIIVLLTAAPLAIGANVLRVILLSLVVLWKGTYILDTFVHPLSGMLTFVLALPIIFWLGQPTPAAPRPAVASQP